MSAPQTSVASTFTSGIPAGSLADDGPKDCVSGRNAEASASIAFGVMVASDTTETGAKNLAATSDKLKGVSVFGQSYHRGLELDATTGNLLPKVMFDVMRHGRLHVYPEDSVTPASGVHVRAVAAGAEVAGAFRGTADGTDTIDVSKFCRWVSPGSSTVAAVLEVDMTGAANATADS